MSYLVTKSMTTDGDGLLPAGNQERNVLADDWFAENSSAEDVTDGAVGTLPHLLEVEL